MIDSNLAPFRGYESYLKPIETKCNRIETAKLE